MPAPVSDEFERLDRVLSQLGQLLEAPGDDEDAAAEPIWQRLDLFYRSMGPDALRALLERQGMRRNTIDDAMAVLERRRAGTAN